MLYPVSAWGCKLRCVPKMWTVCNACAGCWLLTQCHIHAFAFTAPVDVPISATHFGASLKMALCKCSFTKRTIETIQWRAAVNVAHRLIEWLQKSDTARTYSFIVSLSVVAMWYVIWWKSNVIKSKRSCVKPKLHLLRFVSLIFN